MFVYFSGFSDLSIQEIDEKAKNEEAMINLWNLSAKLTGLKPELNS